jgi:hypothetical protein
MILDRLKKIEIDIAEEELEEACRQFDDDIEEVCNNFIQNIKIKKTKNIYIHVKIINKIKNVSILKNLKKNDLNIYAKGYDNNEEKTIKTFKSRIKT